MHSARVKALARTFDPDCWISYSGEAVRTKQAIDARRNAALRWASENEWRLPWNVTIADIQKLDNFCRQEPCTMRTVNGQIEFGLSLFNVKMMIHFFCNCDAHPDINTESYRRGLHLLLREGMIEPTTSDEEKSAPGWSYKATERGRVYVEALRALPLPVPAKPKWVMPD